jgi:chemotaxis methyl-accepting protein methylase
LRNNGYLILGKTEFMGEPYRSRFEHISPTERVYKKVGRELIADAGGIR